VFLAVILAGQLSGWMADRFWPKTHGAGYFVTHVVARTVLGGAIGAAVVIAIISLAGLGRDRRPQP
jgi:uncharacterized membrane protein YeaQ/YmgE (transglycosylase-associated protein family)